MFNLIFVSEKRFSEYRNEEIAVGEITLRDCDERFESSLSFWKVSDYQKQWLEAAKRILEFDRTAFITDLNNPETATFITWWTAWKVEEKIFVQNQLLFLEQLSERFDLRNPYKFILDRIIETEEGEKISEWEMSIDDIRNFLKVNFK